MHSNSYLPHFKSGRALPDPGSSHNFMEEGLARELQGDVEVVGTHAINIAIGHDKHTNELCKSFSWMIQGINTGYTYQGHDYILKGAVNKVKSAVAKKLDKMVKIKITWAEDPTIKELLIKGYLGWKLTKDENYHTLMEFSSRFEKKFLGSSSPNIHFFFFFFGNF
uniref:Uncharacterized protein n=1 Tax=Solanum tuberosum TaxID=4113 RepID=M1DTK0_SOLTU